MRVVGAAFKLAYAGNSIAIWITVGIVVAGTLSYVFVKFFMIPQGWLDGFDVNRREFYIAIRDYICSTKLFSIGVFFITSTLFVIVNTMSIAAAGYPFSEGSLAVISFTGKAVVVLTILVRVTRLAYALVRLPI